MEEQQWRIEVSFGSVWFQAERLSEEDDRYGPGLKGINTPRAQRSVKGGTVALNRAALPP